MDRIAVDVVVAAQVVKSSAELLPVGTKWMQEETSVAVAGFELPVRMHSALVVVVWPREKLAQTSAVAPGVDCSRTIATAFAETGVVPLPSIPTERMQPLSSIRVERIAAVHLQQQLS